MSKRSENLVSFQPAFKVVQDAESQIREMVHSQMRGAALELLQNLFTEEVEKLCGKPFSRKENGFYRGGSEKGSVLLNGQRMNVTRPRIRKSNQEVELESYSAFQSFDLLCEDVMKSMLVGVSTRDYNELIDKIEGGTGLSKSSVSKAFIQGSRKILEEMNSLDISAKTYVSLMFDGIGFGDFTVIAALGITSEGKKEFIGLRQGETENWELCRDLIEDLIDRGLDDSRKYLFVIDGSKALKKAIKKVFSDSPIQRCIRHKERNVLSYLDKKYHQEFRIRWKRLHGHVKYKDALKDYKELLSWLRSRNYGASQSLEESEHDTLTVIRLKVPGLLRKSLSSTNPIESAFSIVKRKKARVTNWKSGNDQVARWAAVCAGEAQKKFRLIRGYKQLPVLSVEIENFKLEMKEEVA